VAAREAAERIDALAAPRWALTTIGGNAATLRHVDGRTPEDVLAYLCDVGPLRAGGWRPSRSRIGWLASVGCCTSS